MNIYQRALEFYLDTSSYLNMELDIFFEAFDHYGICQYKNKEYDFESEIYRTYNKRMVDSNYIKEFHIFKLNLTDTEINRYFTKNYENGQLAATIFAHWFGLTKRQVQQVANLKNKRYYHEILNYFLWNPEKEEYPTEKTYIHTDFNQKYYILDKNTKKEIALCHREDHYLVSDDSNTKFNLDIRYIP